jgi:hypothetical protein
MTKKPKYVISTGDCETDPFEFGLIPMPFVWGFYSDDEGYCHFVGEGETREQQRDSANSQFLSFLENLQEPHMVYMHNGGKFDFLFLLDYAEGAIKIVNGRILEMRIGRHVLRDSYAAVPIPLSAYKKDDIDYSKLAFDKRRRNMSEILHYLGGDVRYLYEMMTAFRGEFGNVLTIGTAAMRALSEHHNFEEFDREQDAFFRQFYYGGRNQCFESGILKGDWKVYDITSSYPASMKYEKHPVSVSYHEHQSLDDDTDFVVVRGTNRGGLPIKDEKFGFLSFTETHGRFYVTGHELRAALETGTFEIDRIEAAYTFTQRTTFETFIDIYFGKRDASKLAGEDLYVLFWKLVLNSGYGKFCLNSDNFKDWEVTDANDWLDPDMWDLEIETGEVRIWSKPTTKTKFYNVATGASITGASRARLLRGLSASIRPVYCDTDSIICESFNGDIDPKRLGAWKHEATGDEICIAGKKLYALYRDGSVYLDDKGKPKQASKGARLSAEQIRRAAAGGVEVFRNPVPAFKLNGEHQFISREIRATARGLKPFGV